jgi:Tannase and feruloyl esterase
MRETLVGALIGAALVAALAWAPGPALAQGRAATDASLPGAIECTALEQQSFSGLADAPTAIISARATPAREGTDAYCAVIGVVQPQILFELRLPARWNGRYFQTGCGGLCGNVPIENCGDAQARGFAVAAHNMGHVGHFWRDALWASEPALRRDFGRRSTHVVALAAKAIIERYYGARAAYSYFRGCSTGGREGLSEAQFFPEDFDGIIAGDPAFPGRQGPLANNWDAQNLLTSDNQPVFSPAALRTLANAVMSACDQLDGVRDDIIDDPRYCRFDPRTIACRRGQAGDSCLSPAQVEAARRLYAGARNSRGQALSIGGSPYGAELQWDGAGRRSIAEAWLRFLAFSEPRPTYNYRDFNFDTDVAATEASAAMFDPVPPRGAPNLSAFERRGGKLIIYHGWADPGVSPLATLDYYAQIAARQGGIDSVRTWFRVFMVPGMYHCRGGNAPNTFDFLPHLMRWVEGGAAPDGIVATQSENGAVVRTRPLYAYPNVARYDGSGDVNAAVNWRSAPPRRRFNDHHDWIWAPAAN